jgi:hypothetical protein
VSLDPVLDLIRKPILVVLNVVEWLRRLPGAAVASRAVPWLAAALFLGAAAVLTAYMSEHSPQRVSLADLAAHNISASQEWFIVSGELHEEQSLPGNYRYTLSDQSRPDAYLIVSSTHPWPVGQTTVSGRISGYVPPMPPGEPWYASMRADEELAIERPPPWAAILLALFGIVLLAGRRSTYPMFVPTPIRRAGRANGSLGVFVHPDPDRPGIGVRHGALDLRDAGATPTLRTDDGRTVPVRVHSRLTSLRVGELRTVTSREPVIRLLSASGDVYVGFRSRDERDAVAATLQFGV